MADKVKDINQYNQLKSKYVGLGNADITREEFMTNVNRDIYSSLAQHDNILYYNSVIMNEPMELMRQKMIKKMADPIQNNNAKKPENWVFLNENHDNILYYNSVIMNEPMEFDNTEDNQIDDKTLSEQQGEVWELNVEQNYIGY